MAKEYFSTSSFEVNIDGMQSKNFTQIEGLGISIEALPVHEGTMQSQTTKKGKTSFREIKMTRRFDGDKEMMTWIQDCSRKSPTKKAGSIILKDDVGKEVMRFNFTQAWPVQWNGPLFSTSQDSSVATEVVVLNVESLEMV